MNDYEHEMHPQSRTEVWLEKILEAVKEGGGGGGGLPTPEVDGAALISSNGQWIQRPGYDAYYEELVQATGGYPDYAILYKAYRVCDLPELPDDLDVGSAVKLFLKEEELEEGVVVESEEFYEVAPITHATDSVIGVIDEDMLIYIVFVKEDGASIVTYYDEESGTSVEFQFEKAGVYLLHMHESDGAYECSLYAYGWSFDPDAESPDFTWDGKLVYQKTIDQKLTMPIPYSSGSVLVYVDGEYVPQSGYGYESPYVEHTWDGNTEGLPQIDGIQAYRVGDPLDFKAGDIVEVSVVVVHDGEEEETVERFPVSEYQGIFLVGGYVFIAKEDAVVAGIEFPRGLYFVGDTRDPNNAMYVSKISGGGVVKMDPKYLPESPADKLFVINLVGTSESDMHFDKEFDETFKAVNDGKTIIGTAFGEYPLSHAYTQDYYQKMIFFDIESGFGDPAGEYYQGVSIKIGWASYGNIYIESSNTVQCPSIQTTQTMIDEAIGGAVDDSY